MPTANFTCSKGLLIPTYIESEWNLTTRAVLYFVALIYCFTGIAVFADVFMCAILKITSSTKKVKILTPTTARSEESDSTNNNQFETVLIWNPTVANLTLMALGSSAPEILLSLIEIVGNDFKAGDLGPGTIVGSAAYNLMVISAICILCIPKGQSKRISNVKVFYVTAAWSCLAYIWLIVILVLNSKDVVTVWEGFLTLLFFVTLVFMAYGADVKIWNKTSSLTNEFLNKKSARRNKNMVSAIDADQSQPSTPLRIGLNVTDPEGRVINRQSIISGFEDPLYWKSSEFDEFKKDLVAKNRNLSAKEVAQLIAKK